MIPHALKPSPRRRPGPQECATHLPTVMPDLIRDPASPPAPKAAGPQVRAGVTKVRGWRKEKRAAHDRTAQCSL